MSVKKLSILKQLEPQYTASDLIIVEALGKYGPRNIYKIARSLGIPESTVRYRIAVMKKKRLLKLYTNIYHTNLGLKKSVVFAEINPKYHYNIQEFFSIIDYWVYMKRIYGVGDGFHTLYISPVEHVDKVKVFLEEMKKLNIIYSFKIIYSTCFHRVNPTTTWYDLKDNVWRFRWEELEDDIEEAGTELPFTLKDPPGYPLLADWHDIMILKELEKDATITYNEIADNIGTTAQNIYYHYKKHIIPRKLIEDFQIGFRKFDPRYSYMVFMEIEFLKYRYLAKTANAFRDKPFAEVMGKVINENKLYMILNLPSDQLPNFFRELNNLVELGYVKDYEYRMSHLQEWARRETVSYKNFMSGRWIYNHVKYMNELYELYDKVKKKETAEEMMRRV